MSPTRTRTEIHLRVVPQGGTAVETTVAPGESISLGRSEEAGFPIEDTRISRLHCKVESRDGEWWVMDLASRNGIWFDGKRVPERALADGDRFLLGKSVAVEVRLRDWRPPPAAPRKIVFPPKRGAAADAAPAPAPLPAHDPLPPLPGPLVALPGSSLGEFRILEQVRSLGRTPSFRALQPSLNRHVLVEVFTENEMSRPGFRDELHQGVQRAAALLHPGVLQIYDLGSARGFTWVTMEFFQGRSLDRVLGEEGFVPIPKAISVARQLCEALGAGLDHGLPVGAISPSDAWLDPEFTLKVKFFREPGAPPPPARDFAYQAPEVLAGGDAADPRAAVYAVGALLYHMLAANAPLHGATKEEFARRARHDTPPPLKRANIKVSPILSRVVEQALAKDPRGRQDGLRSLAREIQRTLAPTV